MKNRILYLILLCNVLPVQAQMGQITFRQPPIEIPIKHYLGHIQVDDFDRDGKPDLMGIIIDDRQSSGASYQSVGIWRNTGDPGQIRFDAPLEYGARTKTGILRIWAQELNGDNLPDLIVFGHPGDMEVYINKSEPGQLRFDKHAINGMPDTLVALFDLELGDIDKDGKIDLVVSYGISPRDGDGATRPMLAVLKNIGAHQSVAFETNLLKVNRVVRNLSLGDMNGDGKLDMVSFDEDDNTLQIRRNESAGGRLKFSAPEVRTLNTKGILSTRVVDMNRDGRPDILVMSEDSLRLFLNHSSKKWIDFSAAVPLTDDRFLIALILPTIVADVDGNGLPDIVAREDEDLLVIENLTGQNTIRFNPNIHRFHAGRYPSMTILADINGDKILDIIGIQQPMSGLDGVIIVLASVSGGQ